MGATAAGAGRRVILERLVTLAVTPLWLASALGWLASVLPQIAWPS